MWLTPFSNLSVLNVYNIADLDDEDEEGAPSEKSVRTFIRASAIISFVHHSLVLISIIVLTNFYPEYLNQPQFKDVIIKPQGIYFYLVFGVTILAGAISMVLGLITARKLTTVDD